MSILKTDWHSLLSPTTEVPPDVTFLVEDELEEGGQGTGKCPQEDWRSQSPPGWCKFSTGCSTAPWIHLEAVGVAEGEDKIHLSWCIILCIFS